MTVNLVTALAIFLGSLAFRPVRHFFFPARVVEDYPLICVAEPYVDESGSRLLVDLFIINRTGQEYTREELARFLSIGNPDPASRATPDIVLRLRQTGVAMDSVWADTVFNDRKGVLTTSAAADTATIRIERITPHGILRVILAFDVPDFLPDKVSRNSKIAVPFNYMEYQDAAYSRN